MVACKDVHLDHGQKLLAKFCTRDKEFREELAIRALLPEELLVPGDSSKASL